jgi:hypothetical protein
VAWLVLKLDTNVDHCSQEMSCIANASKHSRDVSWISVIVEEADPQLLSFRYLAVIGVGVLRSKNRVGNIMSDNVAMLRLARKQGTTEELSLFEVCFRQGSILRKMRDPLPRLRGLRREVLRT